VDVANIVLKVAVIENVEGHATKENVKQKQGKLCNYIIISLLLYMNIWCKQNYGFCFLLIFITICYLIIPSISQIEGLETTELETTECETCKKQCKAKKEDKKEKKKGAKAKKGRTEQAHEEACIKDKCANLCENTIQTAKKGDKTDKKEQEKGVNAKRNEKIKRLSDRALKIKKRMEQFNEQSQKLRKKYKDVQIKGGELQIPIMPKVKKKETFRTLGGDNVGGEPFYGALNY